MWLQDTVRGRVGMTLLGGFLRDLAAPCPEFTRKLRPAHFPAGVGVGGRGAGFR